jgi:GntR family transcriptional regulator
VVTLTLDKSKPQPLYLQLEQAILNQIDAGLVQPGDRLPSERELSETLGISRQTVRQTINQLVLHGLLYRQPGKGTYVPSRRTVLGRSDVAIVSHFVFDWDKQTTVWLGSPQSVLAPPFAAGLLHVEPGTELVSFEHVQMNRGMAVNHTRSWVPVEVGKPLLLEPLHEASILDLFLSRCGISVTATRDRLEPSTPGPEEAAILGIPPGSAVQLLSGTFMTSSGRPIEAHRMVIRGDRFHLEVESHFTGARAPAE